MGVSEDEARIEIPSLAAFSRFDWYSLASVPIEMFFNDEPLATGTAFFWREDGRNYLITNWHNLSGRDPESGQCLDKKRSGVPNRIRVSFNKVGKPGEKLLEFLPIWDPNGDPLWLVDKVRGRQVDVAALPVAGDTQVELYPINWLPQEPMFIKVGMDVFILGYPLGITAARLPIWKRGSIAHELDVREEISPYYLVDTASRKGMSGSPVILRKWGSIEHFQGDKVRTTILGIYSGRIGVSDEDDVQLGKVWPVFTISRIVKDGVVDRQ